MIFVFDYMKVFTIQTNQLSRQFVEAYIRSNQLEDSVLVIDKSPEDLTSEDLLCKRVRTAFMMCFLFCIHVSIELFIYLPENSV